MVYGNGRFDPDYERTSLEGSMTELTVPRDEAEAELKKRVDKGRELLDWSITSEHQLEEAESEFETWSEYNTHLLERIFSDSSEAYEYRLSVSPAVAGLSLEGVMDSLQEQEPPGKASGRQRPRSAAPRGSLAISRNP